MVEYVMLMSRQLFFNSQLNAAKGCPGNQSATVHHFLAVDP
jgi:hypothetical protein